MLFNEGQIIHHLDYSTLAVHAPYSVRVCVFSSGTGASCIYPLLGATMNGWYFLATEVDDICFDYATKNVEQNNLSDLIKGKSGLLVLIYNINYQCLILLLFRLLNLTFMTSAELW